MAKRPNKSDGDKRSKRWGALAMLNPIKALGSAFDNVKKASELNLYLFNKTVTDGWVPGLKQLATMQRDVSDAVFDALSRKRDAGACAREISDRFCAAGRYDLLVRDFGGELFGSATFEGERLLAQTEHFELRVLPAKAGSANASGPSALFHVGGFLPYSDRIFRFLPEANLFSAFLERGITVYALELEGDRLNLGRLDHRAPRRLDGVTMERVVDDISKLVAVAAEHHRAALAHAGDPSAAPKMAIEGYCGLALPTLAYLAAHPEQAERTFSVAMTMVAPVDARACDSLSEFIGMVPSSLVEWQTKSSEMVFGYMHGDNLRFGMDVPLGAALFKSPLGRFSTGWSQPVWAHIGAIDELDRKQRQELAGAYWISPECCRRFPMPIALSEVYRALFVDGVGDDLALPIDYRGRRLSLATIRDRTSIELLGLYGGKDPVVPDDTAGPLLRNFGDRYTHVVHPHAGHISYVMSPGAWGPDHKYAFDPNPIERLNALHTKNQTRTDPARD